MCPADNAARSPQKEKGAIGIVGGGQLAWMLAAAARTMGIDLDVQTPSREDPATRLASRVVLAPLHDVAATRELAQGCQAISFENEWLDLDALSPLAGDGIRFLPSLEALAPLINKRRQRELLEQLALPAPRWCPLSDVFAARHALEGEGSASADDPETRRDGHNGSPRPEPQASFAADIGAPSASMAEPRLPEGFAFPVMAKLSSGGYDGRGTRLLQSQADLEALLAEVDADAWLLEHLVRFEQELSLVACRDQRGVVEVYPLVQTHQHQQVCDWVLAPAAVEHGVSAFARNIAASLLTELDYVGVLSIEFFYGSGGLQINELAPRTHNSGHYTIESAATSQFMQQLRVICGLPLGSTALVVPGALMVNLLGFERSDSDYTEQRAALAALPGAALHWYGKAGATPGRKLGHLTVVLEGQEPWQRQQEAEDMLERIRSIWPLPPEDHPA